ncbi:MAG: hypothetical protein G01um101419_594 [Parcubacteria group bacterium Gr01-1014_19]|nr:MAG: hypothetical protein G01um101419_594 [Parcubacteria group bacterium Gr01-1014_19]
MRFLIPLLIIFSVFFTSGCTTTKTESVKTGLFGDDVEKLMEAFDLVVQGKTMKEELECIGFIYDSPNVKVLPGADGMREIFGEQCFDTAMRDKNNVEPLLEELSHYEMVIFPLREVIEKEDRFYFSTKDTFTVGRDDELVFVLKDGKVIYKAPRLEKIDRHDSEHAFAEGLLHVIEKFGGSLGKVYDLLKKLKP